MTLFPTIASKLSKDLGYGLPMSPILSSVTFTICLLFYLHVIGLFFMVSIYPLINRVTFSTVFEGHIVNEYVDSVIVILATSFWLLLSVNNKASRYSFSIGYGSTSIILAVLSPDNIISHIMTLLSLPLIISIALYYHNRQKSALNFNAKLTLRYISLATIALSAIGIIFSLSYIFSNHNFESSIENSSANQLFLLLSSFSTIYIVLLAFCLAVKVLFKEGLRILKLSVKEDVQQVVLNNHKHNKVKTSTKTGFLLIAITLSVALVLIPQHPSINKDNQDVGVDTHYYVSWTTELAKSKSVSELLYQAFIVQGIEGDRPLSLISIFLVYQVVGGANLSEVIEHLPLILGPGIVLTLYFLTLELIRNEKVALIAAFLGAVSLHTLAGIYAGFYANWLALIVGYISIVFLFRYLRSGRIFNLTVFSTLLMGVLFFHVYTWTILTAVAGIFLTAMLLLVIRNNNHNTNFNTRRITWLLLAILLSVVVDITKVALTGSSGGLERDMEIAQRSLGIEQFNLRWIIVNTTMHHSFGGVFSNFIILTLGLFWVLKSNIREPSNAFIMIFLSAGLVPLFFGSWVVQARVFYNMPFEIPAAIALYYISKRSDSILVTIGACAWLVAVSLFTVMNYYFIPMPGVQ